MSEELGSGAGTGGCKANKRARFRERKSPTTS